MNFVKIQNDSLIIYPNNIETEIFTKDLFAPRKDYTDLCRLSTVKKTIFQAGNLIGEKTSTAVVDSWHLKVEVTD